VVSDLSLISPASPRKTSTLRGHNKYAGFEAFCFIYRSFKVHKHCPQSNYAIRPIRGLHDFLILGVRTLPIVTFAIVISWIFYSNPYSWENYYCRFFKRM